MKYNDFSPMALKIVSSDETVIDLTNAFSVGAGALRTMSPSDAEILKGNIFTSQFQGTLAAGLTKYITFITPVATQQSPLFVIWARDFVKADVNNFVYRLLENVTFTPGGALTITNPNRVMASKKTPQTLLYNAPTAVSIAGAIEIDLDPVLGSQGTSRSTGGASVGLRFFVLKPNTKYGIELKNNDSQTANYFVKSMFYEAENQTLYNEYIT
jgi:hypothetical protein